MRPHHACLTITTNKIRESEAFYREHLGGRVAFDSGWYLLMRFNEGAEGAEIAFMQPQDTSMPLYSGGASWGVRYDTAETVAALHQKLIAAAGLPEIMPLEDHPWGDRGFATLDPNGVVLYLYTPIPPAESYRGFFKEYP